jgi:hypothetical protein
MALISKNWSDPQQIAGVSDGYITLSGVTEQYSSDIDLETNGYDGAHVVVEVNFDTTPTDYVDVALYASLDGVNYDDTSMWGQRIDKLTSPNQISFIIRDLAHARVGVKQTGNVNSHDVRMYVQKWKYVVA